MNNIFWCYYLSGVYEECNQSRFAKTLLNLPLRASLSALSSSVVAQYYGILFAAKVDLIFFDAAPETISTFLVKALQVNHSG